MRGFFAIGIEAVKTPENVGGLWRSAHAFDATFMFTIGARYPKHQATDTTKAWRHIPLFEFEDLEAFNAAMPRDCEVIGVDCDQGKPRPLPSFRHPERAVYVLGAEDHGLSPAMLERVNRLVEIPTVHCLNVATAGAIVMYDRTQKVA